MTSGADRFRSECNQLLEIPHGLRALTFTRSKNARETSATTGDHRATVRMSHFSRGSNGGTWSTVGVMTCIETVLFEHSDRCYGQ
jgi:hypothetical protein